MRRLLIRPGAIGDFIVSLPALQFLRADYTEVWCPSSVGPLVQFADRVVSIAGSGVGRIGLVNADDVINRLRGFDEIHSWYGTNQPEFRASCAHLPVRFHAPLPDGSCHAVDFYLRQVGAPLGAVPMVITEKSGKTGCAVLHPYSGSASKNWPLAQWHALAELLGRRMPIRWCCGPDDPSPVPDNAAIWRGHNLLKLATGLSCSRVFIGNDSGISHLAASVGTPVIALFGPTNPNVWAPRGPTVNVIYRAELAATSAEMVAEAVT